ncbi:C40 family peptidase [Neisseria sp. Ec49-e6-T10]|uniref:C40 family peptidase n=1 Tax=Neisseria sp. Ec49-e6-T10 TaxID=3140744 RepID=UPI003EBF7AE2
MKKIWQLCLMLSLSCSFSYVAQADELDDIIIVKTNKQRIDEEKIETNKKQAGDVIMNAMGLLGVPYVFGGSTPKGLDCSGFIQYVFKQSVKVTLPRTAAQMAKTGQSIERSELKPGDLVFFNTRGFANSHVGLYIGNNKFMHAPRTGKTVEVALMTNKYWNARYNGARRVDSSSGKAASFVTAESKPLNTSTNTQTKKATPSSEPKKKTDAVKPKQPQKTDNKKSSAKKVETKNNKKKETKKTETKKATTTKKSTDKTKNKKKS